MSKKSILLICSSFYPFNTSGALRLHAFARGLINHGYSVHVLTVDTPDLHHHQVQNGTFPEKEKLNISRSRALDITEILSYRGKYPSFLCTPDRYWPWFAFSFKKASALIKTHNIVYVLSSSPVQTSHLIAAYAKKKCKVRWIADFRDPWLYSKLHNGHSGAQLLLEACLERYVVESSDIITVTNNRFRHYLQQRYHKGQIQVIQNGFNESDFLESRTVGNRSKCTLLHAGNMYSTIRDPSALFEAISQLKNEGAVNRENLMLSLLGPGEAYESEAFSKELMNLGIDDLVEISSRIPHTASIQRMLGSDCLILLQCADFLQFQIPAKAYEYVRCRKPILAMVSHGATSDFLKEINPHWILSPEDTKGIKAFIKKIINNDPSIQNSCSLETLSQFERSNQTSKLVDILDSW